MIQEPLSSMSSSNVKDIYHKILTATVIQLQSIIKKHIAPGIPREFLLWALSDRNPRQKDYLQLIGVLKTVELGVGFLSGLFDTSTEQLASYIGAVNALFVLEIVSDNLAIGLAPKQLNKIRKQRKEVLINFNNVMQRKLAGETLSAAELLQPQLSIIKTISSYQQNLAPLEMQQFAKLYQEATNQADVAVDEIEYSIFTYLILNIESCIRVTHLVSDHPVHSLLTKSFAERYAAVNALFSVDHSTSLDTLVNYGTKTILVIPTMLYMIGAIDKILPNPDLKIVLQDGRLLKSLENAACIIRLSNDIGTKLLHMTKSGKQELCNKLKAIYQKQASNQSFNSLLDFLENISDSEEFFRPLARIRKDIKYGEFNICLDNLRDNPIIEEALNQFFINIDFCATLYQQQRTRLLEQLETIKQQLKDERISQLILRMVTFHEKLYAKEFEASKGEYAIPSQPTHKIPQKPDSRFRLVFQNETTKDIIKEFKLAVEYDLANGNFHFKLEKFENQLNIGIITNNEVFSKELSQKVLTKLKKLVTQTIGELGVKHIGLIENTLTIATCSIEKCSAIEKFLQSTIFHFDKPMTANEALTPTPQLEN